MTVTPLGPPAGSPPNIEMFTRNGFAGPTATLVRSQYSPTFTHVQGSYTPQRFDVNDISEKAFTDGPGLPVPVLVGDGVSIEVSRRSTPTDFGLRNALADEMHYVLDGEGRLDTDFGVLHLRAGDFVLLPRGVTYRYAEVTQPMQTIIVATVNPQIFDPEGVPGVINPALHVDVPKPDPSIDRGPGTYETVVRHGDQFTRYFYDYDPMPTLDVIGPPVVIRFNIEHVHGVGVDTGGLAPPRLINDPAGENLFFYLGSRRSDRAPVHHNADFDEVIFYVAGPGVYGAVDKPGSVMWTPKGITHHGPAEEVPEGYHAWLLEARSPLTLTAAGKEISQLMETNQFAVHPSTNQLV